MTYNFYIAFEIQILTNLSINYVNKKQKTLVILL